MPDDQQVLCANASAEAFLKGRNTQAMTALSGSADAHYQLGYTFMIYAGFLDHQPSPYRREDVIGNDYHLALNEFARGTEISPARTDILVAHAYTVWQRAVNAQSLGLYDAGQYMYEVNTAARNARRAIEVSRERNQTIEEINARETYGEILMVEGRYGEALEQINQAISVGSDHDGIDEFRWDRAQALACSAAGGLPTAATDLAFVKRDEEDQEIHLFTEAYGTNINGPLSLEMAQKRCFPTPDKRNGRVLLVSASTPVFAEQPGCTDLAVIEAHLVLEPGMMLANLTNGAPLTVDVLGPGVVLLSGPGVNAAEIMPPEHAGSPVLRRRTPARRPRLSLQLHRAPASEGPCKLLRPWPRHPAI